VERVNCTLVPVLSITSVEQCRWDQKLTEIEQNLNTAYNKVTKKTPFETIYGYYPNFSGRTGRQLDLNRNLWVPPHKVQAEAKLNIEEQQVKTKEAYDETKFAGTHFTRGEVVVMLKAPNQNENAKLQAKYRARPLQIVGCYRVTPTG